MFSAMRFGSGVLHLIDQRRLPSEEVWIACDDLERVALAIEDMAVRGAPAIACAAAFGLAIEAASYRPDAPWASLRSRFEAALVRMASTRPTAVNLFHALARVRRLVDSFPGDVAAQRVAENVAQLAEALFAEDLVTCRAIGKHGAELASGRRLRVLTHCNTGSLATAGYGTALGVIRALHDEGLIEVVYADETRPWLQGARLTAFELAAERIPYRVIADAAAAWLMQKAMIDWVIVGADRIAANGDTANKIGTYALAVHCHHHRIPFWVAAPMATFDLSLSSGADIPVEERSGDELRQMAGRPLTPVGAPVFNPSFDVTPASLISGVITEVGVLRAPLDAAIHAAASANSAG